MKHIKKLSKYLFFIVMLIFPAIAFADSTTPDVTPLEQVLCNIFEIISGPIVTAVITVTIISTGLGGLFGKVSWTTVVVIFIAGAVIVGAPQMAAVFTSVDSSTSSSLQPFTCGSSTSS
ncbi:TrbC/VirB2 family protein [Candidatus Fokinia solitaria]|uniref:TrbC/VirB2 family protein n=1 Tax=Candidatus Fokinia solitaria TaxID=1802984 RepID=A0A2U8BSJ4_9RICK|nr:TrbC/VirB2 family protein [Candidatus Fokinia solitaria]AWD33312.1 TrbC/VirB2 family protein [Candidatus Fokinia solitaria]